MIPTERRVRDGIRMDRSEVVRREYTFGDTSLSVNCRKYAKDTTKVSISMQLTVEQIWVSCGGWGLGLWRLQHVVDTACDGGRPVPWRGERG